VRSDVESQLVLQLEAKNGEVVRLTQVCNSLPPLSTIYCNPMPLTPHYPHCCVVPSLLWPIDWHIVNVVSGGVLRLLVAQAHCVLGLCFRAIFVLVARALPRRVLSSPSPRLLRLKLWLRQSRSEMPSSLSVMQRGQRVGN
jgi:hypothetical protein